jgi:hypothetical protein
MHPSTENHRQPRTSIPSTGLGSILVARPALALVRDLAVVAERAVAAPVRGVGEPPASRPRPVGRRTGAIR